LADWFSFDRVRKHTTFSLLFSRRNPDSVSSYLSLVKDAAKERDGIVGELGLFIPKVRGRGILSPQPLVA